jgi:hypothetical protein
MHWEAREEKRGVGGLTGERRRLVGLGGGRLPTEWLRVQTMLERWVDISCSRR